jgi:hypothetical protein
MSVSNIKLVSDIKNIAEFLLTAPLDNRTKYFNDMLSRLTKHIIAIINPIPEYFDTLVQTIPKIIATKDNHFEYTFHNSGEYFKDFYDYCDYGYVDETNPPELVESRRRIIRICMIMKHNNASSIPLIDTINRPAVIYCIMRQITDILTGNDSYNRYRVEKRYYTKSVIEILEHFVRVYLMKNLENIILHDDMIKSIQHMIVKINCINKTEIFSLLDIFIADIQKHMINTVES